MDNFRIERLDMEQIRLDMENDVVDRDQDRLPTVPTPPPTRRGAPAPGVANPIRVRAPNRRGRPGRPPARPGQVPTTIQNAFRHIHSTYERMNVLDTENTLLRSTGQELQERLLTSESNLEEMQQQLSTVIGQRDTIQQELQHFKVDNVSVRALPLVTLTSKQAEVATLSIVFGTEMARRIQLQQPQQQQEEEVGRFFLTRCPVCMDDANPPTMVMVNCGHCLCEQCSIALHNRTAHNELFRCPNCRAESDRMQKLYCIDN